jgi:hypothetical protein
MRLVRAVRLRRQLLTPAWTVFAQDQRVLPARGSVSGPITSRNSTTEPGQPWLKISGTAPGSGDVICRT